MVILCLIQSIYVTTLIDFSSFDITLEYVDGLIFYLVSMELVLYQLLLQMVVVPGLVLEIKFDILIIL